jgi:ATP-binding cassette subfamily B protein
VIAHRLATIRKADKILVMDHGTIVETGSFDELYAQGGRFTQLVKEQFSDASGKFIS